MVQAADKLGGTWKLAYTSNSELMGLLALNNLPFVTVGDIKQTIDAASATVINTMDVSLPGSTTSLSTTAAVTVQSPKRFNIKFEKGTIGTPQLMSEIDLPDSTMVMGQNIDLRQLKSAIQPLKSMGDSFAARVRYRIWFSLISSHCRCGYSTVYTTAVVADVTHLSAGGQLREPPA